MPWLVMKLHIQSTKNKNKIVITHDNKEKDNNLFLEELD